MAQTQIRDAVDPAREVAPSDILGRSLVVVSVAMVVGLVLRLVLLGSKSFWLDETLSIQLAADPQRLWGSGFDHSHPPLYYALLHSWLPLGDTEFMLRLSSALTGALAMPLSYWLAVDLGGRRVGVTTVWLVALAPLLVWYAQELRSYSLLVVLGLLATWALARLVTRPHVGWWLLFVIAMTAALYTHYAALLLIPIQVAVIAVCYLQQRLHRLSVWLWLAAWPAVLLLYWPWLTAPGMRAFIRLMFTSNLYPIEILAVRLGVASTVMGAILVAGALIALVAVIIIGLLLLRRGPTLWQWLAARPWVRVGVLLIVLILTVFGVVPRLYTVKKLVVALWPYGLLVVAWIFPWQRANRVFLALLLTASLAGSVANVGWVPKDQWRALTAQLMAASQPGDAVWIVPHYQRVPLNYYMEHWPAGDHASPQFAMPDVAPTLDDDALAGLVAPGQRVWLIYHAVDYRLYDPNRRLATWLDAHMVAAAEIHVFRVDAKLYTPRP